jgi:ribonucleoside-diphosphate reductase alpha chain
VGGGVITIVNNTVPAALNRLGYTPDETEKIVAYVDKTGSIEGAPALKSEHLPVFDCSLAPAGGGRSITWTGHVGMMSAAQPFLSGAISKTINMPEESTIEDVMDAYIKSWKLGLKAVAIYRDNSKKSQPLSASGAKKDEPGKAAEATATVAPQQQELFSNAQRKKLPDERKSITHKFWINGHEGYITVGMYDDGNPGEVFIKMAKEGSTLSGVMDGFALTLSIGLQYGVPLRALVDKLINTRFEPSGFTHTPDIRIASSVLDYIARWLGGKFISMDYLKLGEMTGGDVMAGPSLPANGAPVNDPPAPAAGSNPPSNSRAHFTARTMMASAPTCSNCGMLMTPNGSCYKCSNCGGTSGCS